MDEAFESITGNGIWRVALVGLAGAAILGRRRIKPLAKNTLKGYFSGREWVRERFAETTERLQDLYAEAKYEYQSELGSEDSEAGTLSKGKRAARTGASASKAGASA